MLRTLVNQQDRLAATEAQIALNVVTTYKSRGSGWQIRGGREFIPADMQQEMGERTNWGKIMSPEYSQGSNMFFDRPDPDER